MSSQDHPRKCENWLSDFLRWTIPRSEAKESYIFWTGLFTLACVLRRHVKVPEEYLGSWECWPYLYLIFIGPPGNKKTTTTKYNVKLLEDMTELMPAPNQITVQYLASCLKDAPECAMYINAGELSEFIAKSGKDMWSFLTKAFDGDKSISVGTHMRGIEYGENPCINFLGATTLDTLNDILPQASMDGGFGRRCIFIYEEEPRRRKLIYKDVDVKQINVDHKENLISDLRYIANNLFGDFHMDKDTYDKFDQWYKDGAGYNRSSTKLDRLKGYHETKPAFVMKIAMLLKIADGNVVHKDQLILNWDNLEEAIAVIEGLEPGMNQVVSGMGRNVYKTDTKTIFRFIQQNSPIKLSTVLSEFASSAEPSKLEELIKGLNNAGLIVFEPNGTDIIVKVR